MRTRTRSTRCLNAVLIAAALTLGLAGVSTAWACPNCSESVATTDAAGRKVGSLGEGFNYSVLFMMAMPFAMVAGFGGAVYWHLKNNPAPGVGTSVPMSDRPDPRQP
jgi:hypothetical protein